MDKYKILLIDANTHWISKSKKISEQVVLPIGLMYLSSYLKKNIKHPVDIRLINTLVDTEEIVDVIDKINSYKPDLIGIRVLSTNFDFFQKLVSAIPGNHKIVVGGPHVNLDPTSVLILPKVDFVVLGEGEETFLELVTALIENKNIKEIKGLGFKNNDSLKINPLRPFIENLDSLPFPDYSIIDLDKYAKCLSYGYTYRRQGVLLTSRGCPFNCHYCFNFYGRKFRKRSAQNVFEEIKYLHLECNIKDFFVTDDTFNIERSRCIELFKLIINSGININLYFSSGLRGDLMDEEFIDLMVKAGTIWITFGVETVNKRVQKVANRFVQFDKMKTAIEYCCEKGIMVGVFFMVGFPTETKEEAMETLNFVKSLSSITMPYLFGVKFYPGTQMYKIAEEMKIIDSHQKQNVFKPYHEIGTHKTDKMTENDFKELFVFYMRDIFLNKDRLRNAIRIQRKYLSDEELNMVYSTFLNRKIDSPEKTFNL
jgi:anaerobic magnesium-protoporphyrin IX monomethyl ester cyclase